MGLVTAGNPPDGWITSAWNTVFFQDTAHVLHGQTSIKIPSYGAGQSAEMIGPPVPISAFDYGFAPIKYVPKVYVYCPTASGRLSPAIRVYTGPTNINTPLATFSLSNSLTIGNTAHWVCRSNIFSAADLGVSGTLYARFVIAQHSSGSDTLWVSGVELPRIAPGIIGENTSVSVPASTWTTISGWTTTVAYSANVFANELSFQSTAFDGGGGTSGIIFQSAGMWLINVDVRIPTTLAAGSEVAIRIVDGTTFGSPTVVSPMIGKIATTTAAQPVANVLQYSFLVYLPCGAFTEYGGFSGYPYVIQIYHNDAGSRTFGPINVYATLHR